MGNPMCTHLSVLCLKVFKLTTFPMTLGILLPWDMSLIPLIHSVNIRKKFSLARVNILCALYVPSIDNEYSVILGGNIL